MQDVKNHYLKLKLIKLCGETQRLWTVCVLGLLGFFCIMRGQKKGGFKPAKVTLFRARHFFLEGHRSHPHESQCTQDSPDQKNMKKNMFQMFRS